MSQQTEAPVVLRVFAEKSASVNSVLDETKAQYGKLASSIESVGRSATLLAGSATAALGGLLAISVQVAGQFEQLQAKLESTLGSSEAAQKAFQSALKYAATTPFDVQSIVSATVTLEAFGQSSQRVLPIAANLAAAFGENIKDISLIVGKAFSGSLEGFEGLRNRLGIGNLLLQKYGAELTKTGSVAITTSGQLEKARDAIQKIVETRFGDATARQSQTLFGALSNLSDSVQRVASSFGQALIPVVTGAARFLTTIVDVFDKLDPGMKKFLVSAAAAGAIGLGLVTAIAAISTVVISGVGNLVAFAAALQTVAVAETAAAAGAGAAAAGSATAAAAAAGFARLAPVVSGIGTAISGFAAAVATALGPLGILVTLLGGAAFLALDAWKGQVAATETALQEQSRGLQQAREELALYEGVVEKVTGSQKALAAAGGDIDKIGSALRAAFANVSDSKFVENLRAAGVGLDDLKKAQQKNREEAKALQDQIASLNLVYQKLSDGSIGLLSGTSTADVEQVKKALGGLPVTTDNVRAALQNLIVRFRDLNGANLIISQTSDRLQGVNADLDEASKSAQSLGEYLRFATKTDDVSALRSVFGNLDSKIGEVEASLSKAGIPIANMGALQEKLLDGTDEEKRAVKELLGLYEARENLTKKIASQEDKAIKDRIQAVENQIERERVLGDVSLAEERKRLSELLSIVKANSDEELSLRRKIKELTKAEKKAELDAAKNSLGAVASDAKDKLEELRASGQATAADNVKAIEEVIARLDRWGKANAKLVAQNPELRKELSQTVKGFQKDLDSAQLAIPKERLDEALKAAKAFGAEATTNAEKFAATQQALSFLQKVQGSGQINTLETKKKLQGEIDQLTAEEAKLQKEITKEAAAQARETAGLKREAMNQELEVLKAEAALEGQSAFRKTQIAELEKKILAEKIQAIRDQEQAELASGVSAEEAAKRREIRITEAKEAEVLKRAKQEEEQTKKVEEEAKKQQDILDGFRAKRLGGKNSPLISQEELNASLSFLPNFSLDTPLALPKPPSSLRRVRDQVDQDIKEGERLKNPAQRKPGGSTGKGLPGEEAPGGSGVGAGGGGPSTQVTKQFNLGIQGYPIESPEVKKAIETVVEYVIKQKKFNEGNG